MVVVQDNRDQGLIALYIFDDTAELRNFNKSIKKLIVCPITMDHDRISIIADRLCKDVTDLELVNFPELFNKTSFSRREEYLKFISEFPDSMIYSGKNLKEYFKFPFKTFSAWWFSSVAEKSTLKSDSYGRLCKLLTILDIQEKYSCKIIFCDISDYKMYNILRNIGKKMSFDCVTLRPNISESRIRIPELLQALFGSFSFIGEKIFKIMALKWKMRGLPSRREYLKKCRFLLITYFPLVDKKQLPKKKFVNRYYQPIQRALENKYPDEFLWLAIPVNLEGFSWIRSIELGKSANEWGYPMYLHEEWISIRDLCKAFFEYAVILLRYMRVYSLLSRSFVYPGGLNIWAIFRKDWHESFAGKAAISGIINYYIFRKIFAEIDKETTTTYFLEMQPWERALNIAASDRGMKHVLGIQHTTVPLLLLNFFEYPSVFGDSYFLETIPSHIGCAGSRTRELFISSGWDSKKVFVLGAIRFQQLRTYIEKEIPWDSRENDVIAALSIELQESMELLSYVIHAFRETAGFRVLIKGHPALSVSSIIQSMQMENCPDEFVKRFIIIDTPLHEILPACKAMIVTGSSSSLESIACQCPIIIPRLTSIIDMNPLSGISDIPIFVNTPQELRSVTEEIMKRKDSPLDYKKCRDFIMNYCDFITDNEFLQRIEDLNKETGGKNSIV